MKILSVIQNVLNPVRTKYVHAHYPAYLEDTSKPPKQGCVALCGRPWKEDKTPKDRAKKNANYCPACTASQHTLRGIICTNCG